MAKSAPSKIELSSAIKQSVVQEESPVSKPKISTKPVVLNSNLGIHDNITPSFEDLKLMRPIVSASHNQMELPKFNRD